jgi:hypothetical protein
MMPGSHQARRGRTVTGQGLRPPSGVVVAPFFPLVRGWTVTPRAPALASRASMVRLAQAAPAEAGAGVRHSLPLLKLLILLIWRAHLAYATCGAPSSPWLKPLGYFRSHATLCPPSAARPSYTLS